MPIQKFPDPRLADSDGLIGVGGDLHPDSLYLAYRSGIFPWPMPEAPLCWFCPGERAILRFDQLHTPRSLMKAKRQSNWTFTCDQAFEDVIHACAAVPRPGQDGSWITDEMIAAYIEFHRLGHAHSIEVWEESTLIGGIYGVDAGGAFAGESMFYRKPNASKLALLHLVDHLRSRGAEWIDIQMMTPHMKALGAELISRDRFLILLEQALSSGKPLF